MRRLNDASAGRRLRQDFLPLAAPAWLPPDWSKPDNELSVGGLAELRRLLTRSAPTPAVRTPRVAQLADVLQELHRSATAPRSWWARLKQWLRGVFTPQPGEAEQGWLARLIGGIDLSQRITLRRRFRAHA